MKAQQLIDSMVAVGFTPEEVSTMHLKEAIKVFINKVNDMCPEGDADSLPDGVVDTYNDLGETEITDWPEAKPIPKPRKLPPQCLPREKPPKEVKKKKETRGRKPKKAEKVRQLRKDMYAEGKSCNTSYRGNIVEFSRTHASIESLRYGGTRLEIIKRADKLYMAHGGGSNLHEQDRDYMNVVRTIRALKLLTVKDNKLKLMKFIPETARQYRAMIKKKDAAYEEAEQIT